MSAGIASFLMALFHSPIVLRSVVHETSTAMKGADVNLIKRAMIALASPIVAEEIVMPLNMNLEVLL